MIGFDLADDLKQLRKILLQHYKIFTGEAKPNIVRLLPAMSLSQSLADDFLERLIAAVDFIQQSEVVANSSTSTQTINNK
jgi:acetylornithine aminotransferase